MNKNSFLFFVVVSIIAHIIRSIYEILKHKNILKPGKISFVIILFDIILLFMSWFPLCSLDTNIINLHWIVRYRGILITGLGLLIFLIALFTIKTLESYDGDMISRGIYSKIRHPMYLGLIFWLIGFPLFYGAVYAFILGCLFAVNVLFWRYLEEKELDVRFSNYREYRKTTIF
jgi:protein-S-isoprenylcysteine O-methyltransferase Ste14